MLTRKSLLPLFVASAITLIALTTTPVAAHGGGGGDGAIVSGTCGFDHPEWRNSTTIAGVKIAEDRHCTPDNPYAVAASVKGTNNVPMKTLMKSGFDKKAVVKKNDRDNDGDPDVIHITLEVVEFNGKNSGITHEIAPGVSPTMWGFAPKTSGMVTHGSKAAQVQQMPSPSIRVEQGDTVRVTLDNTHYLPHTIHLHGIDHNFTVNGSSNDGVPQTGDGPIPPGGERTYEFKPTTPGTMFYHCHVVPGVHVQMGLNGLFTIEESSSNNTVQTFNLGNGKVRHPSNDVSEENYTAEYDLLYQSLDKGLASIMTNNSDPADIAQSLNREYDITDASSDYFLLNGRSFPYTLHESLIIVEPGERYKLHVGNAGPGSVSLHTHGHKFNITAHDGVSVPESQQTKRDVVSVSPAQRETLALNTTIDGMNSYGRGLWFTHDHHEKAVTTNGISPGGGITIIGYKSYLTSDGMPDKNGKLRRFFNESYYDGEIPLWEGVNPSLSDQQNVTVVPKSIKSSEHRYHTDKMKYKVMMDMQMVPGGMIANERTEPVGDCEEIRGTKSITVKGGTEHADTNEIFGYHDEKYNFKPCTKVTVTFENTDKIRHQWMVHGLPKSDYPGGMFTLEADGGETVKGTFVVPKSGELMIHCSVDQHAAMGMQTHVTIGGADGENASKTEFIKTGLAVIVLGGALLAFLRLRNRNT